MTASKNDSNSCGRLNTEFDEYQCTVILTVKRATATFSLIGCIFMLFVIWLFRRYNSLAQKMIMSLTVAAFFDSVAYVMGEDHPEGALCTFQAWWLTYFDWCALAWVCLITLNLYVNLVKETRTEQYTVPYHVLAWGVPLLMSCLPLFAGYYGPAGPWCWITDNHVAWRFGIWYAPLFSLIFLMTCCYFRIIYVANKRMQSWFGTFNPERERRKGAVGENPAVLIVERRDRVRSACQRSAQRLTVDLGPYRGAAHREGQENLPVSVPRLVGMGQTTAVMDGQAVLAFMTAAINECQRRRALIDDLIFPGRGASRQGPWEVTL